jgi:hypothetical protein
VLSLWPIWKWLQCHLDFTEACKGKKVQHKFETVVAGAGPSEAGVVFQQQAAMLAM